MRKYRCKKKRGNKDAYQIYSYQIYSYHNCSDPVRPKKIISNPTGKTCPSLENTVSRIQNLDDGKIKIEVSKTSDGTFPVIHTLNFKNKPWSSDQKMFLAYLCVSSDENNDINHKLYLCNPQTSYKISRIQITSKDNKLLLTELTLKDPKCENTLQYD
ncbi:MAG: hypothetical protein HY072_09130, partial [Deltaproteobacteria bacterium]|nr:hypothetical protein [Deltaproteobacteria bacterium]